EASLLNVQDLAAQRQHRLVTPVASLLHRATRRVTLNDVQLGLRWVPLAAVSQLAGQSEGIESTLTLHQFACLASRLARPGGRETLLDDPLGSLRILLQLLGEQFVDHGLHRAGHICVAELALRLA